MKKILCIAFVATILIGCSNDKKQQVYGLLSSQERNEGQVAIAFAIEGDNYLHTFIHGDMKTNAKIKLFSEQEAEDSCYSLCNECVRRADIVDAYESIGQHPDKHKKRTVVQKLFDKWEKEDQGEEPVYVWICTGSSSHAYHSDPDCEGLQYCKADIEEIELEDAEDMGRTPCHFCHDED